MAERLGDALLELGTDDRRLIKGIDRARARAIKLGESFRRIGRQIATFVTAPIAALATVTARLADTQIQAERTLASVLKLSGGAVDQRVAGFKAFASALQEITIVGDEVTLKNLQVAKSMGLTDEQAKRAAKNAIALSAAFGINAKSAIRYTAALEQGDTEMLNRYIPTLRNIKDQTERAAAAQRILTGAFETATEAAKAGLGPFRQMLNDLGDLGEEFGTLVLPALTDFAGGVRKVIAAIRDLDPVQKKWIVGLTAALAAGGPILIGLGLLSAAIAALLTPIGLVVAALAGAAGLVAWLAATSSSASQLQIATDNVVRAMGDEIRQTQLLGNILNTSNIISVEAARQKLAEAKARLENVTAIIAEQRALAIGSETFAEITRQIDEMQAAVGGIVVGARDDVSRRRADAFESLQQSLVELLNARQALIDTDERLADQARDTAANIAILDAAIAAAKDGLVTFGEVIIEPIEATARLGEVATATTEGLGDIADAATEAENKTKRLADQFANAIVNVRTLEDALASLQNILMQILTQQASSGLSGLFQKLIPAAIGLFTGGGGAATAAQGTSVTGTSSFPSFAHGAGFTVGGRGGVDSNLVQFMATRGERVDVTPVGGRGGVEVNVYAPPGSTVEEQRRQSGDLEQINILIDNATAGNMRPGTNTDRAMRNRYGQRQALITR